MNRGWDFIYPLWLFNVANWEITMLLIGKSSYLSSINEPFSVAMLNNQRVYTHVDDYTRVHGEAPGDLSWSITPRML